MGDTEMLAEIFSETGIIVVLVVVVLLFGSTQLPKLARSLGSAQSEFKKGVAEGGKGADAASGGEGTTAGNESADAKKD
jgi:sec-independent protein translocase protein TatA